MSSFVEDDAFEDFSDLIRGIINEMGYNVEEQQLHEIEKDLLLIEENADVADSKLFSCLLDNLNDLTLFASDPDQSLQQLAHKVADFTNRRPLSTQNQSKNPHEFDQLIAHGYERLQEVYEDIRRYERLEMDSRRNGHQNNDVSNETTVDEQQRNSEEISFQKQSKGFQQPSTSTKRLKSSEKENRQSVKTLGKMNPREEARLLNQYLKTNAMRRTMCPEPGRLPFKHDKQLKLGQYRREWAKKPPPGEQKRMALRWRIRELMMMREIPQLRIVTTEQFSEAENTLTGQSEDDINNNCQSGENNHFK